MGKLSAVCLKNPPKSKKQPQERKETEEVNRSPIRTESTDVVLAAPKSSRVSKKKPELRRDKGIVIDEGALEREARKSPQLAPGDKGKKVLHEPPHPSKKQKTNPPNEPTRASQTMAFPTPSFSIQDDVYLKGAAGPGEVATAGATLSRVVNSLNTLSGEMWTRLMADSPNNLLDFGFHALTMVFILTFKVLY